MLLAGLKTKRNFRHLQIYPTTANASGYVSLPCVKGGGTAYAVTEGLLNLIFIIISMTPQAAHINVEIARICNANQNGLGPILRAIWA